MPYSSKRPCAHPGCTALVKFGYCDAHKPADVPVSEDRKAKMRLYGRAAWQRARRAQLAEFPWCARCLRANIWTPATDVHHLTPHHGDLEIFIASPKESLCHSCHSIVTAEEQGGRGGKKVSNGGPPSVSGVAREKNSPIETGI